jgi:hypothetical protein
MLSRFRRPGADLRIQLDRAELRGGDELEARVDLLPKSSFHIRHGIVELICTETYVQKTSSQYGTHYQKKTQTRASVEETFSDSGLLKSGVKYSTGVRLLVPPDAPRTVKGTNVRSIRPGVAWEVRASLDVVNARNLRESQEVTVLGPRSIDDAPPGSVVGEVGHRQCNLTLAISSGYAHSGDKLDGTLSAEILHEVAATEVRVELVRVEKFGNDAQDHVVDQVTLEREVLLNADFTREWRFPLHVGHVVVPSLETEKSSVRWVVKGVLARAMRPDLRIEQEIVADF